MLKMSHAEQRDVTPRLVSVRFTWLLCRQSAGREVRVHGGRLDWSGMRSNEFGEILLDILVLLVELKDNVEFFENRI